MKWWVGVLIIVGFIVLGGVAMIIASKCGMSIYAVDELGIGIAMIGVAIVIPIAAKDKKQKQ